ncbi:MAG: 2,6-beta-D-fructofuranosidase, partial [Alistipes sp.]|nr:2,6-beta-D-fructofuranosidase [Alistipes sp.]
MKRTLLSLAILLLGVGATAQEISLKAQKQYLNIPISHKQNRERMTLEVDGKPERTFNIRI